MPARKSQPATATIHDQKLQRGAGGELHQTVEEGKARLTTAGRTDSGRSEQSQDRVARPGSHGGFSFSGENFSFRS